MDGTFPDRKKYLYKKCYTQHRLGTHCLERLGGNPPPPLQPPPNSTLFHSYIYVRSRLIFPQRAQRDICLKGFGIWSRTVGDPETS